MNTDILIKEFNMNGLTNMTLKDKLALLKIYYIFSEKEDQIFDLIYSCHGEDSWEDIF
jgi:hypothetical protein